MFLLAEKSRVPWGRRAFLVTPLVLVSLTFALNRYLLLQRFTVPPQFSSIDWSPARLKACHATTCLLRPPFSKSISVDQAFAAQEIMSLYLNANIVPVVHKIANKSSPYPLCSVIGGAPVPPGQNHSAIIDKSIVFRLNVRIPEFLAAESVSTSLGSRTDIVVLQWAATRQFERYIQGWGEGSRYLRLRRTAAGEKVRSLRPTILYRSECPSGGNACSRAWGALARSSLPSWIPVSFVNPHHELEARRRLQRLGMGQYELPSTGIVTIINALSNCRHTNLFGFNGSTAGDGDFSERKVWRGHAMTAERALIRWFARCSSRESWLCGRLTIYS